MVHGLYMYCHSIPIPPLVRVSAYVRVTLTVRGLYTYYHSIPIPPLSEYQRMSLTVRGLYMYYHSIPILRICLCQSNSDRTWTVHVLLLLPHTARVRVSTYVRVTLTVRGLYTYYHSIPIPPLSEYPRMSE